MGEREYMEYDEQDAIGLINSIGTIDQDFWEDGERHILASTEAPEDLKGDFAAILEVTNLVYESKLHEAVKRFNELTQEQQRLLAILILKADGEIECDCPNCTAERIEAEVEQEKKTEEIKQINAHYREMTMMSRKKTYEVSEDIYEKLMHSQMSLQTIMGRLETIVQFVDEDDVRSELARQLLDDIYY